MAFKTSGRGLLSLVLFVACSICRSLSLADACDEILLKLGQPSEIEHQDSPVAREVLALMEALIKKGKMSVADVTRLSEEEVRPRSLEFLDSHKIDVLAFEKALKRSWSRISPEDWTEIKRYLENLADQMRENSQVEGERRKNTEEIIKPSLVIERPIEISDIQDLRFVEISGHQNIWYRRKSTSEFDEVGVFDPFENKTHPLTQLPASGEGGYVTFPIIERNMHKMLISHFRGLTLIDLTDPALPPVQLEISQYTLKWTHLGSFEQDGILKTALSGPMGAMSLFTWPDSTDKAAAALAWAPKQVYPSAVNRHSPIFEYRGRNIFFGFTDRSAGLSLYSAENWTSLDWIPVPLTSLSPAHDTYFSGKYFRQDGKQAAFMNNLDGVYYFTVDGESGIKGLEKPVWSRPPGTPPPMYSEQIHFKGKDYAAYLAYQSGQTGQKPYMLFDFETGELFAEFSISGYLEAMPELFEYEGRLRGIYVTDRSIVVFDPKSGVIIASSTHRFRGSIKGVAFKRAGTNITQVAVVGEDRVSIFDLYSRGAP